MYLDAILDHNQNFVTSNHYEPYKTSKLPNQKSVILTCMDTRLVELLPAAMNIKNGDVKMVKNAGGVITSPYDSVVRSLLVAIYVLQADEVIIIGHEDCGMRTLYDSSIIIEQMKAHGVTEDQFQAAKEDGVDVSQWLKGFETVEGAVENSVNILNNHPLLPTNTPVHGLVIHPETGELTVVQRGYDN
ncbi:carbonic anhydrase [Geomicrobium halophilum]|uniref:carbonic anhydrase n=1 Tax=Geomicrobium halophilum TaxID=549000 RepID=A0A841PM90_9BACL|nr:carbonic anhydrase [Geomicrobium halophilum]MBB6449967.1 carbonic anhydrase [Geomicrobium halophilum]